MLTLSLLLGIGGLAHAAPSSDDINLWLGAVVLIETGPNLCAGTLIDERGTIATAYHCVASGWTSRVSTLDGREARAFVLNTSPRWWRSGTPRALKPSVGRCLRASSPGQ